jgi:hypothetical protein
MGSLKPPMAPPSTIPVHFTLENSFLCLRIEKTVIVLTTTCSLNRIIEGMCETGRKQA